MKKAGSNSKDRLAKSGNPKKRTPSGGVLTPNSIGHNAAGGGGAGGVGAAGGAQGGPAGGSGGAETEPTDPAVVIWPEWSDAEVLAEKATKHVFEDPESPGTVWLPRSLRGFVESFKRPIDLAPEGQAPVVVQAPILVDDMFHNAAGPTGAGGGNGVGAAAHRSATAAVAAANAAAANAAAAAAAAAVAAASSSTPKPDGDGTVASGVGPPGGIDPAADAATPKDASPDMPPAPAEMPLIAESSDETSPTPPLQNPLTAPPSPGPTPSAPPIPLTASMSASGGFNSTTPPPPDHHHRNLPLQTID
ncbi:hypothetical protein BDK51DRAFT_33081 [Blyttiomyces helicus]|uniref:Uncharacterized protein n=1 Tax=Blyttiomyces helicus TaxID=388810 RepID=A0A4P9WEM4_9FUNG|nr:hypothetical protein BDK51DRAFT_33081 [Blyttiomyces helicus]|eukprot:RKO89440.1 hypothetical protein BDK51DRAFT_33081 [Blyttiomyces helicus]